MSKARNPGSTKQLTSGNEQPTVKQSSDELNPVAVTAESIPPSHSSLSLKDYLALAIATCGVGYLPLAPGTWGSLVAVAGYSILHILWFPSTNFPAPAFVISFLVLQLVLIALVTFIGTWAASQTERMSRVKDPQKVVVDEVAGQLIALLPVPAAMWKSFSVWMVVLAFVMFRFFDIVKPYPARKLESLKSGWGIMADDLVAGVYAAVVVALVVWSIR